ncbi:hypothetical protein DSO57_1013220 [Entomophthora muscae]|uniref:Uncharacterized protein n=1 Tax=Entomophthora muscae TaxID=34485 RepID=A0ACC2TTF3_9FUNG|nr:hypothetical protein DSO57_1013220 [Entomophthora muscae]
MVKNTGPAPKGRRSKMVVTSPFANHCMLQYNQLSKASWQVTEYIALNFTWRVWTKASGLERKVYFVVKPSVIGFNQKICSSRFHFEFIEYNESKTCAKAQRLQGSFTPYFIFDLVLLPTTTWVHFAPSVAKERPYYGFPGLPRSLFYKTVNTKNIDLSKYEYDWALYLIHLHFFNTSQEIYTLKFIKYIETSLKDALYYEEDQLTHPKEVSQALLIKKTFYLFINHGDILDDAIEVGDIAFWFQAFILAVKYEREFARIALNMCYSLYC